MPPPPQVLRAHRDSLLTVLEVLIHDPLYKWAITPITAQRRQQAPHGAPGSEGDAGLEQGEPGCL